MRAYKTIRNQSIFILYYLKNSSNQVGTRAAATGISYFEIYAIGSSNVGWEYPSASQSSTGQNHGGFILYTTVLQIGLGNNNGATMNGLTKQPFQTQKLCGSDLHNCVSGEIVKDFLYYFNYSGQQSGNFTDSVNSVASPFGYWSDSIYTTRSEKLILTLAYNCLALQIYQWSLLQN